MKEKGSREEAGNGRAKSFSRNLLMKGLLSIFLQIEAYICSEKGKLQNNMKQQNYSEGRMEINQNGVV